jgi:PAS domain S-box-containing protein
MQKVSFERSVLRDEYMLYQEKRAANQWEAKSEEFKGLLKEARERFTKPSDRALLEEIEEANSASASIFPRLREMHARMKNKGQRDSLSSEGESRLVSQLVVKSYARAHGIDRLQDSARKASASAYQRTVLLIVMLMFAAVIITIANTAVINNTLAKRIAVLLEGTEIMGAGNLDYRIHMEGDNELSSLARASNEMAGKLKESHTSVENLYKEIAERKRVEDEIRATLYGIGDGVIATDAAGHVKRMNPVAETLTGWSESEALDKPLLQVFRIINEETRQPIDNPVSRVIREGLVVGLANHSLLIASDGKERPIADSGAPIHDASGVITGAVLVFRDQTAERAAAAALRKSEEKYRDIIENAVEGIYQTSPTGQYISANPAYARMLGYESAEELMGSITDIPKQLYVDQNERTELLRLLAEHGSVSGFEIQLYRKDRSIINLAVGARAVKGDKGNFVRLEGMVEDITARKHAEEELRRLNEDLLRSNSELEQFAYVASHDLQEPLRMVSSYTQLLAKRYEGKLDQDAHDFIHYAVDGANRMQRLIQDLLAYSRITTRGSTFVPLDLHEALGEAIANLQTAINESSAMVTNDELPTVNADSTQLVQVFQNLVGNAIKFRKEKEPPRIHVSAERAGSEWIISVRDNGIGIDPQYFNRLFTIFQRLNAKQEYPGTGIGLALCKRIVTRHGGKIWVRSTPGEGTTFRFTMNV